MEAQHEDVPQVEAGQGTEHAKEKGELIPTAILANESAGHVQLDHRIAAWIRANTQSKKV